MFKKNANDEALEKTIASLIDELDSHDGNTEAYAQMVDQLTKLYAIKNQNRVSKETWATIGAHLAGVALVVEFERVHVMTSKAFTLLSKLR